MPPMNASGSGGRGAVTQMTEEWLADLIREADFKPGDRIRYVSDRNFMTFVRFGEQGNLLDGRPDHMIVQRGDVRPPAVAPPISFEFDDEKPRPPEGERNSTSGKDKTIWNRDLLALAQRFRPNTPIHVDTELKASGNDRSLLANLLLHLRGFRYMKDGDRTLIVWCPDDTSDVRGPKLWTPPEDWSLTPTDARNLRSAIHSRGIFDDRMVRNLVSALDIGCVALFGPPGCGKNHIVDIIGETLGIEIVRATVTPDWNSHTLTRMNYLKGNSGEFMEGQLTLALQKCVTSLEGPCRKPVWLFIDELNRCPPEKVLGQIMTLLGSGFGERDGSFTVPDDPDRTVLRVPRSFRIIVAYNDEDGDTVARMSEAVRRRFAGFHIDVPPNEADGRSSLAEWEFVRSTVRAASRLSARKAIEAEETLAQAGDSIRMAMGLFRTHFGQVGTARLITWAKNICTDSHFFPCGDAVQHADHTAGSNVLDQVIQIIGRRLYRGTMRASDIDTVLSQLRDSGLEGVAADIARAANRRES